MPNRIKFISAVGMVLNLFLTVYLLLFAYRHSDWAKNTLPPDLRAKYFESLLDILCNQLLPLVAGGTFFSAIIFGSMLWKLAKAAKSTRNG